MINYPDLIIEVAGYTDAKGSTDYNKKLANKRAQAVINYFTSKGIDMTKFVKKAFGESNFTAINSNPDGSDNPEGRKYNRRVTFGIRNPKTGVVLRQEAYTPQHLRQSSTMKYSIVLERTTDRLYPGYFSSLINDEMLFVRTIMTDSLNLYVLGVFYNRPDAVTYLGYLRENGLKDYIINQYDIDNLSEKLNAVGSIENPLLTRKAFTIQLKATKSPIEISRVFSAYEGVKEILSDDGFYKYVFGEYESIAKAREALTDIKKDFDDAFIKEINVPLYK
jgi:hypothetical protein